MRKNNYEDSEHLTNLIQLIKKLRAPDGCPWDGQQKKKDIGKYILEEAYEVMDALEHTDHNDLKEELGDLLFQILFITEICSEEDLFSLGDVMEVIHKKMIRRHPHVFGNRKVNSVQDVKNNWQQIKNQERKKRNHEESIFSSVPRSLPALKRAQKITSIASTNGFDWNNAGGVLKKLKEELREFDHATRKGSLDNIEEELGDILFTVVNLSRFFSVDAETALSKTTEKFLLRFSYMTGQLASLGITPAEANLAQMDTLWNEAKSKDLK
jgi:tetrapyrrole methylase family protein / MazG family protein